MGIGILKRKHGVCAPAWVRPAGLLCLAAGTSLGLFHPQSSWSPRSVDLLDFVHGVLLGLGIGLLLGALLLGKRAQD
jgi:hypothetical protein